MLQGISNGLYQQGALSTDYNEFMEYHGGVNNHTAAQQGTTGRWVYFVVLTVCAMFVCAMFVLFANKFGCVNLLRANKSTSFLSFHFLFSSPHCSFIIVACFSLFLHRSHQDTPWLRNSSDDDFQGLADDGPLLIDDEESDINISIDPDHPSSPGREGREDREGRGHKTGMKVNGGSNVNSPRKPRGKSSFFGAVRSSSADYSDDGAASPVDKKNTTLNAQNKGASGVSNWLGKNIFGSFKLPDDYSLYNTDEQTALLTNNNAASHRGVSVLNNNNDEDLSLDVSILEQGGNAGTDSGNNSPVQNGNIRYLVIF